MATTWLELVLQDGCRAWDTRLQMLLSLVLQSSLSCRGGNIARSQGYQGLKCLQWQHITMKLRREGDGLAASVEGLEAYMVLRFTKGDK